MLHSTQREFPCLTTTSTCGDTEELTVVEGVVVAIDGQAAVVSTWFILVSILSWFLPVPIAAIASVKYWANVGFSRASKLMELSCSAIVADWQLFARPLLDEWYNSGNNILEASCSIVGDSPPCCCCSEWIWENFCIKSVKFSWKLSGKLNKFWGIGGEERWCCSFLADNKTCNSNGPKVLLPPLASIKEFAFIVVVLYALSITLDRFGFSKPSQKVADNELALALDKSNGWSLIDSDCLLTRWLLSLSPSALLFIDWRRFLP